MTARLLCVMAPENYARPIPRRVERRADAPDLLEACRAALVQIKQDNDERKVEAAMRGTENMLRYVLAKVERGQP